MSQTMSFKM